MKGVNEEIGEITTNDLVDELGMLMDKLEDIEKLIVIYNTQTEGEALEGWNSSLLELMHNQHKVCLGVAVTLLQESISKTNQLFNYVNQLKVLV